MSETQATDRNWRTTVNTTGVATRYGVEGYTYEHVGPAEFKIDAQGNLRIEVYPENSDFEVVIALFLAGTFHSVSQEVLPEETGIELPEKDVTEGGLEIDNEERQVHDPESDVW